MAEGRGFEPPVDLRLRLISSQVPLTTQPPFQPQKYYGGFDITASLLQSRGLLPCCNNSARLYSFGTQDY